MIPKKLNKGDKVAIISLSSGVLGMPFCAHELKLGIKRLEEFGLVPVIMPNSLKGMDYIKDYPEERAKDLKEAFMDDSIKAIICAIGGDDTYKTIPYLMEDKEFTNCVKNSSKIFIGYSDSTNNHLMLNKLGLSTFYGMCFLTDIAELDKEMLPFTKEYFEKLFTGFEPFYIKPSPIWYYEREKFDENELGTPRKSHKEDHGFEVLNGSGSVTGRFYGGCIESIYNAYTGDRYDDENIIYSKYNILLTNEELKDKVLFLETSDEKILPSKLEEILLFFKDKKILESVKCIIVGKPMDEAYYDEYKEVYKKVFIDLDTPVLYNVNFGHAFPKLIIPYDRLVTVDFDNKKIFVREKSLED